MKNHEKKFITIGYSLGDKPAFWYGDSERLKYSPKLLEKINTCEKIIRLLLSKEDVQKLQEFEQKIEETVLALRELLKKLPEEYHAEQKKGHKEILRKSLLPLLVQIIPDIEMNLTVES